MSIDILTLICYYNHVRRNKRAATDGPEVAGLEWSKVDLENGRLEISANLCYSKEPGIYETTTKTGNVRFVNIPAETVRCRKNTERPRRRSGLPMGTAGRIPGICSPRTTDGP